MEKRQHEKKRYLPSLVLTVVFWLMVAAIILGVDPQVLANIPFENSYVLFFVPLFLAVLFMSSLLLGNTRRGLLTATGVVIYGLLRIWGLGNWLNSMFIVGAFGAFEFYFNKR
jgi:hypothetical protein